MIAEGQVGIQLLNDGANQTFRMTKLAALVVQELHGRFYEQCYRANLYTYGISNTALVAANAIATGMTATAQPIIGLWNPLTSTVNLVILQASIVVTTIAASAVAPGGFMWVYSQGNSGISTGSNPVNTKTLASPGGSAAKAFSVSTPLTGLANNLAVLRGTTISPLNAAGAATAASIVQGSSVENVDAGIIVPPGGFIGIMNQVSTTTINVTTGIVWEEVSI